MNILPRIETIAEKKLIGRKIKMSLVTNKTFELFSNFMPRSKEIINAVSNDIFDLKEYPTNYFSEFDASNCFIKWALIEVSDFKNVPDEMGTYILKRGQYAIFEYKGLNTDNSIFQYIYQTWIPNSNYLLDDRPHFEILGEKHKNNDPNSEEEIWIPIMRK